MSEPVQIYVDMISEPCRSVVAFCKLSGIPFECVEIDLIKSEFMSPEFTLINPYQAVPAIVHGSYKLNESAAIVTYLADTFNVDNEWYPKDIKTRGKIHAFWHWHHQALREKKDEYIMPKIVMPLIAGTPLPTPDEEVKMRKTLDDAISHFEWVLSETGYAARTPKATIADIFAYSEIAMIQMLKIQIAEYPKIKTWFDEIGANPIVQEVHEKLNGFLAGPPSA